MSNAHLYNNINNFLGILEETPEAHRVDRNLLDYYILEWILQVMQRTESQSRSEKSRATFWLRPIRPGPWGETASGAKNFGIHIR